MKLKRPDTCHGHEKAVTHQLLIGWPKLTFRVNTTKIIKYTI